MGEARVSLSGRSPRARGRRERRWIHDASGRSIPACAGETLEIKSVIASTQVDPRVRGGDLCRAASSASK